MLICVMRTAFHMKGHLKVFDLISNVVRRLC